MDHPARLVMPEASSYRTAIRSDLPQIVEIYNSTIPWRIATADTEPVSVESRVHWFEEHTPDRRPLWVVEDAGRVAAWLSFSTFYGRPAYAKTAELSVYVHEAFRKRGFGSYLLTQALAHAPTFGVDTLLGFIFGHNEPSLALFRRFGFQRWGEMPKVALLDGVERDLIIVGRRVGNADR
jgi:L-amino acid N-acyltransferase YncA